VVISLKNLKSNILLAFANLATDRRLGNVQFFCCLTEVQLASDG
jgi:hypothetical protein